MAEIVVVGAGIFGLACGWEMVRRGWKVTVVDRDGVAAGASGGVVGTLSPHVPENWSTKKQFQLDALLEAESYWRGVEAVGGGRSGYGATGRLIPIPDERGLELAQQRAVEAAHLWQGRATWQIAPAELMPDWVAPQAAPFGLVRETLSGRLSPAGACAALAATIRARGGEILSDRPVTEVADSAVSGPWGQLQADAVLIAAGAGSFPLLAPFLGADAGRGVKGQAAAFGGLDTAGLPTIYADGVYIVPHADGSVAVGSTSENTWEDATATDARLDAILQKARAICPALGRAREIGRWAGVRPRRKKPDPALGAVPGLTGVYLATAGFKISFGIAPAVARGVGDIIEGRPHHLPPAFLLQAAR